MGGVVGLAITVRIAWPAISFRFAMPEAVLAFFPDVGASWFLPRLPCERGTFCALTGAELNLRKLARPASQHIGCRRRGFPNWPMRFAATFSVDAQIAASQKKWKKRSERLGSGDRWEVVDGLCKADHVEDILAAFEAASGWPKQERGYQRCVCAYVGGQDSEPKSRQVLR